MVRQSHKASHKKVNKVQIASQLLRGKDRALLSRMEAQRKLGKMPRVSEAQFAAAFPVLTDHYHYNKRGRLYFHDLVKLATPSGMKTLMQYQQEVLSQLMKEEKAQLLEVWSAVKLLKLCEDPKSKTSDRVFEGYKNVLCAFLGIAHQCGGSISPFMERRMIILRTERNLTALKRIRTPSPGKGDTGAKAADTGKRHFGTDVYRASESVSIENVSIELDDQYNAPLSPYNESNAGSGADLDEAIEDVLDYHFSGFEHREWNVEEESLLHEEAAEEDDNWMDVFITL